MVEKQLVVDHLKFSYEGLFNTAELYNLIMSFFYEKGWDWKEKLNQEIITPNGKQMKIILQPWKSSSDFYKIEMKINIVMTDVKEVEVEVDGKNLRLNQGLIRMTFDGAVLSDRHGRWTLKEKPLYWFILILSQKYFFKNHFKKFETWIKSDIDDLLNKIKTFLNVYKYSLQS
jgi:hypothetical protein